MRTVIYQSYRTANVPAWLGQCLQTVQSWAAANRFDYQFIDDRLFRYVPPWFLHKASGHLCTLTDLARLLVARELLDKGYDRTVWVDADLVVFAPEALALDSAEECAFCHEAWVEAGTDGQLRCSHRVNNSVTVFTKASPFLDFYIDACQRIARSKPQLGKLDIGTGFLTNLRAILPFPLLGNIGVFSPFIMAEIASGAGPYLPSYMRQVAAPLAGANLCSSLRGKAVFGIPMDDRLYETVVARCLQTKGDVVNRFFHGPDPRIAELFQAGRH